MTRRPQTPRKTPTARAPFRLSGRWAAAIFALLVALLFHDVALEGMTFVSPDTTAPAGFVRVGEQTLYGEHAYPLWNPFVFLGMPSYASGAYNPLIYPPDWPLALVAKVIPLPDMIWLLLYYFLGAFFTFLLAREWGARPEGALLAGAAYVFAPNLVAVGSHGHGSQLVNSAYVPLLLWLAARWMRRGGVHHLGWLALAGGFQMLRGHVQIAFYTWLAIALWLVVAVIAAAMRRGDDDAPPLGVVVGRAFAVGGAMAVAFGIAAVYNLPLRDYARYSIRGGGPDGGVGMDYATAWSLGPWELPTIVLPGYAGFANPTYWGGMPFTDYPNAYVGMVAVVAAIPALLTRGAPQAFALVLMLLSLGIAFGRHFPLYGFLYDHLPLFNKFRIPVMVIVLFQLGIALALSWGVSRVLDEGAARRAGGAARAEGGAGGRLLLGVAIALGLLMVVGLMAQDAWRAGYLANALRHGQAMNPSYSPDAAAAAYQGFVGDLARVGLLGLLAAGALVLARRGSLPPLVVSGILLVLLLVEIWPVSARVMAPVIGAPAQNRIEQERDDVVTLLEAAGPPGSFRILPLNPQEFQSNRYAGFAIASVGGYHAAKPRLAQIFIASRRVDNLNWMRLLNVRYVLVDAILDTPGLREVLRGQRMIVYENGAALPRATVVGSYRVATADSTIIDSVAYGGDPALTTWLVKDPGLTLGPVEGAKTTITKYGLNEVTVDVETPGPGLLRLADLWYPDWTAKVDGRPAEVLRADFLLRAVAVPAGRHQVAFRFESASVRTGLWVSIASLLASVALIAWGAWAARRPRPAREPVAAAVGTA